MTTEIKANPLRYAKTSQGTDVFLFDRHIGTVIRGSASVFFRSRVGHGRGILYPNLVTCVQALVKLSDKAVHAGADKLI